MNLHFLTQRRGGCPTLVVAVWLVQIGFAQIGAVAYAQSEALQPQKLTKAEQAVKLEQMDQRWREAQSARDKGDFPTAIKAADDLLEIGKTSLGDDHKALIGLLEFQAQCHEASADFAKAKQVRADLVLRVVRAYGPDDYRVVDAKLAVKHVATLATLTEDQRKELSDAVAVNARVVTLYGQGQVVEAAKLAESVLETRQRLLGNHRDTTTSLNNLAAMYLSQGNYAAAEPLFQRALKIREMSLGPVHPETAGGLNNLASLYKAQGNYTAAEPLYQRALRIMERAFDLDHPNVAASVNNLAALYDSQGKYAAAEPLYQRALKINEKSLGPDHPYTALSLNTLGGLYKSQGKYAQADPLYQRALKIREKALGRHHPDTATSLNNLALLYESQGNYSAAESLFQRALTIREKALGPNHPSTATGLNNLGMLNYSQGTYAAAEPLYQRALKIREMTLGPDHPDTATSLNNLAALYKSQGKYAAAEPLYQRALKIREKMLGRDHPLTATSLNSLAALYESQGDYAAAEPLFRRSLKVREESLGPDHPDTATGLDNLAGLYDSQGNDAAAEPLYQRALKIREKALGPHHPDTATSLNNLAALHQSQGNYAAAEPLYQRALKIKERALGPDHPDTATSLNNLASLHHSQAKYAAAEPIYQRALIISEKSLGPDHPDTATSLINLASLGWNSDQPEIAAPRAQRALGIQLRHLDQTAAIQTELQQFLMSRSVSGYVSFWLTVSAPETKLTEALYRDVLAWKGLITARQQGLRLALKDDPLFSEFRRVTQQLSTVSLSPPLPPSDPQTLAAWKKRQPELRQAWESQKATLEMAHQRVEQELAVKSVPFRESLEQRRVRPADLAATLTAQAQLTALVDVLEYRYSGRKNHKEKDEGRIVAFVVRGDQPVARMELGAADEIAQQIAIWRGRREQSDGTVTQGHPGTGPEAVAAGNWLREHVWEPLLPHLHGIETVLISPDGALTQLSWGALPGEKPGSYLIEERAVAVIPVPQMLPSLLGKTRRTELPSSLLLAGDIDYGGDPGHPQDPLAQRDAAGRLRDGRLLQFAKLSAAQAELSSIKDWYENADANGTVQLLRKQKAIEASFRQHAPQNQWLHVITHGFFAPAELTAAAGIGVAWKFVEGRFLVTHLVTAGAAQKDGRLQISDEILSIANSAGEPVAIAGKSRDEIGGLLRGPVGTDVHLQVRPKADPQQTVEIILTRAPLPSQKVNSNPPSEHPGLLSGLAFAGANTPPEPGKDDGILTALEVAALDLNQVDCVVLSACETGLGEVAGGEGLLGLQRAFQVSGARTVVASLWKVPDAATAKLMQRFYENLWDKKLGKLEALREAQIWMLHDQSARGLSDLDQDTQKNQPLPPYYWAAFVLSGDWR